MHHVENAVDHLVATSAENGRAQYLLEFPSTSTFMNPCVSPFSMALPTRVIGRFAISTRRPEPRAWTSDIPARPSRGSIQVVCRYPVRNATCASLKKIGRHNLEIVVRSMRESAASIAIAQRPNTGDVGSKLIVHRDITTGIAQNAGFLRVPGRRHLLSGPSASSKVRSHVALRLHTSAHSTAFFGDPGFSRRQRDAGCIQTKLNALAFEDLAHGRRYVFILARDRARGVLDDCDLAAEASENLAKFQSHISTPDNHEMFREGVDVE